MTMPATTTISSAHAELGQATTALREGRFPDARKHAENALAAAEEPNALLVLGMACLRMGDLQAALVPLKRARELTPNRTAVHANLGDVLAHLGEVAEARASFRRAMELDPEHAAQYETRWVMMGRALHFQARGLGERMVHRDVASLLADVHSAVARDDLGHAFGTLALFGQQVLQHQLGSPMLANADLALGHREIDACIDALGARVLRERRPGAPRPRRPVTVHIATRWAGIPACSVPSSTRTRDVSKSCCSRTSPTTCGVATRWPASLANGVWSGAPPATNCTSYTG